MNPFDDEQKAWIADLIKRVRELDFSLAEGGFLLKEGELVKQEDVARE